MSRINVQVSGPKQADFTYKTVVLKGNVSFKDQIETAEGPTKFVIRWDFDLNDEFVTVPENCILEFDGGSLKNGTIIGQDTVFINVGDVDIWGENLVREGTWREKGGGSGDQVQSDWNQKDETQPDFIKNKPTIFESDRPYDPIDFSGMGKVYLPKNIVNGRNILTQDMFYKGEEGSRIPNTNTIFVVMWDFDLDGENITIPENCALEFDGGSISNGVVFSNKTVLMGKPNMEKYFGAFKDVEGRWLDHDLKPFEIVVKTEGYIGARDYIDYPTAIDYTGTQSVAICEHNNKEYVLIARINVDDKDENNKTAILISVTDIEYNTIGYTYITNYRGHANGITVDKNGYLLLSEGSGNYNYYKVPVADIISNAANNNAPTSSGEVISDNYIIHDFCYDKRNDMMLWTDVNFFHFHFRDSNGASVKDSTKRIDKYYLEYGGFEDGQPNDFAGVQQICSVNGIIYNLTISQAPRGNYLEVIDAQSEELILWHTFRQKIEVEGICFHDNAFYIVFQNSLLCKLGTHGDDFTAMEDYLRWPTCGTTVYVDNSPSSNYQGIRTGSYLRPFRSLTEALAATNGYSSVNIAIAKRAKSYAVDMGLTRYSTDGSFQCYQERLCLSTYDAPDATPQDTKVTINGMFYFRGFVFRGEGVTFDGNPGASAGAYGSLSLLNTNEAPRSLIHILFNNCTIKNYLFGTNSDHNLNIEVDHCVLENISGFRNAVSGNMTIKNSSLINVADIDLGEIGSEIVLIDNRYTNTRIARPEIGGQYPLPAQTTPRVVCMKNEDVDNLIYDYLNNNLKIENAAGIDLDIQNSTNAPSEAATTFGVSYVKGIYRCFDASLANKGFCGLLCKTFPVRYISQFNAASAAFKNLFTGLFSSYFYTDISDNQDHSVRILRTTETVGGNPVTNVTAIEVTPDGRTYYNRKGSTRPTMYFTEDVGNEFFDTTINKMIYWTGDTALGASGWITADGGNPDA